MHITTKCLYCELNLIDVFLHLKPHIFVIRKIVVSLSSAGHAIQEDSQNLWREKMIRIPPLSIGKIIICSWLLFGVNTLSSAASLPVFEQVGTIIGPASSESTPFTITESGSYLARITDLTFFPGSSFNTVALGISTSSLLLGSTFLVDPNTNDFASFIFSATPEIFFQCPGDMRRHMLLWREHHGRSHTTCHRVVWFGLGGFGPDIPA
jgi:hypothetical protein